MATGITEFDETPVLLQRLRAWQVASLAFRVGPTASEYLDLVKATLFAVVYNMTYCLTLFFIELKFVIYVKVVL